MKNTFYNKQNLKVDALKSRACSCVCITMSATSGEYVIESLSFEALTSAGGSRAGGTL